MLDIAIVGGGFSGIGTAIALDRAGLHDYEILEDGDGFGGTWRWNRYPGIAVDIPSFSYQFSFAQRWWSRVYAPGAELLAYAEEMGRRYDLGRKARFGVRVTGATFDEAASAWTLETTDGPVQARHVIDATGVLTVPRRPDIPGLEDFAGDVVHTARWDESLALEGKRVGVIGTGASAVQLIPAIAERVAHLTVFQRTPIWCMPKVDGAISARMRAVAERVPGATRVARVLSQALVELTFPVPAHYARTGPIVPFLEKQARAYLAKEVRDPEVRDKLTPRYAVGCKRPSFHNTYLRTFNRDDVALETTAIERITPAGIVTADGVEHALDVLVLATGFRVFDPGNFPKYPVRGRGGRDLEAFWAEHRHQAYEGVSIPGFPNYFTVFGPYSYNGSSYFNLVETSARHIARALRHARDRGATTVEVTAAANARYFAECLDRRGRQVFWQPSCTLSNSYYFDQHGDVPLRPMTTLETVWRSHRFPLADYAFSADPAPTAPR